MDDNSIIRTESSYQTMNEPLPDIIHTCRTDTPRNVSSIEPQLSQRAQTPDQTNNRQTSQLSQRAQTSDQTNNRQTFQLRNQRSRSYANALRLQPNDQDMQAGSKNDFNLPYARHYKPRLVYFFTPFPKTIYVL